MEIKKKILEIVEKMRPRWAFLFVAFFVVIGIVVGSYEMLSKGNNSAAQKENSELVAQAATFSRRMIDGVSNAADVPVVAVMIENAIDARPLSGVARANLVWEAPVEAGITRLLALYADDVEVEKIGPVRSARPYYVDWAEEFRATYAHVGGSPEALDLIPTRLVNDLNQFWFDQYFWRSKDRFAPHNVYTSTELLRASVADRPVPIRLNDAEPYTGWKFKDDAPADARPETQECTIVFSSDFYTVNWKYDQKENIYIRWQMQKSVRDTDGTSVRAKNIAVMATDISILDSVGRRRVRTTGEGTAFVIHDGKETKGIWKRENREARTRFYDENGDEIEFNAGVTWIEVVPSDDAVACR
ncbi:MAG: DUF3048 domain-containing protein [bacterium]|nr:DUF3048 domain-containing protein [bacterium]